jgi:predicted PurR-regulated permease PerM
MNSSQLSKALQSEFNFLKVLQVTVLASVILFFGRNVFIPISFALLISFVLYPICAWLERKGLGRLTAIVFSISLLILLGMLVVALLVYQFVGFLGEWPTIYSKLGAAFVDLTQTLEVLGVSKEEQSAVLAKISDQSSGNFMTVLKNAISASAFSFVLLILIPVYAVLILYYRSYWMKILGRIFPSERTESLLEVITLTIKAYYNFIKGMAIVYIIVGSLNSVGLLLLGVPHAILFGFIASILTFVPYVGIIVGSLLPITMAWITYDSVWYPVGIVAIFSFVQYLEANVIFPVAVSNRLNVNTLVMLVSIFVGGILWGMAGMILFVPFVGIAKLIADHNPKWKTISMILGTENKNLKPI